MSENILAPIDFSDVTDAVVAKAAQLAKALDAKVWLIHAAVPEPDFIGYEVGPEWIRDSAAKHLREEHRMLGQYQEKLRAEEVDVTAMLVPGEAVGKILSTPMFPDIFLTIKVADIPEPRRCITTPRNCWILSLFPSRIL